MKAQQLKMIIIQEVVAKALIWACVACVTIYATLLFSTMFYATETTSFNRQIVEINGTLSELEFEYISLKQSVTLAKARELGFKEIKTPVFVRSDVPVAVSLR